MTRAIAVPAASVEPRVLDAAGVAAKFSRSVSWFRQRRVRLELRGFPMFDELVGGWLESAVDAWFDARAGIGNSVEAARDRLTRELDTWQPQ